MLGTLDVFAYMHVTEMSAGELKLPPVVWPIHYA